MQVHTKVFRYILAKGENFFKAFLKCFHCTKYNEIKRCHSDVQKPVSYTGPHKRFLIHYGLCLETVGNVFSIVCHGSFLLC